MAAAGRHGGTSVELLDIPRLRRGHVSYTQSPISPNPRQRLKKLHHLTGHNRSQYFHVRLQGRTPLALPERDIADLHATCHDHLDAERPLSLEEAIEMIGAWQETTIPGGTESARHSHSHAPISRHDQPSTL